MANSRRYKQLESRIRAIENNLMPKIKPSGNYTKKEQDFIRGYLMLVHAEIEAYFEEISEDKAKKAFSKWRLDRTKSNVLVSLVSFHENSISEKDIETRVNKALSFFINGLRKNHGIKEDNVLSMLLPIGIEEGEIDSTWLNTITSFAASRGEIAHTAAKVQHPLDPVTLKTTVQQVVDEIKEIDVKLRLIK